MRLSIKSLGSDPEEAPILYHWYLQDPTQPGPIARLRILVDELTVDSFVKAHIIGEFGSLLKRMKKGLLKAEDEVKPVRISSSEPLFELRAHHALPGDDQFLLRVYNVEPPGIGSTVVGLHLHRKLIYPDAKVTNAKQDLEINKAVLLYHRGKPENWGLPNRV